ncbi:hypothetical protein PspLS_09922 [Pyricularia sp. CBS 133598]|nr:hypothetical protein PspLS_09922 [Pyricularia sp. CBS 133598]
MHIDLDRQMQSWTPNLQLESPLFSKLPPEIRQHVFALALTPLEMLVNSWFKFERVQDSREPHDFRIRHDHDGDPDDDLGEHPSHRHVGGSRGNIWGRYPENTGPGTYRWLLSPTLLATCRRVYVESHMLLYDAERSYDCVGARCGRQDRFPPGTTFPSDQALALTPGVPKNRTIRFPWTKVEHVRLFTSYKDKWLREVPTVKNRFYRSWHPLLPRPDDGTEVGFERVKPAQSLELGAKRHLELRNAAAQGLDHEEQHQKPGRPSWMPISADRYPYGSWARDFVNFPRIKTLTMNFHCPEDQRRKHEDIIQFVVDTWRFPLNPKHAGHHYLSVDRVKRMSWRGNIGDWLDEPDGSEAKIERGIGPRMYTWTVVWTPKTYEGPETYPYGGLVEVGERDYQEEGDSDLDEDEEVDWEDWGQKPPPDEERGHRRKKEAKDN